MQTDDSYRPDIDGLRAVAVLAVVAFHAFPQWLPGGYIGVDVFFVISGFLISSQLMAGAAAGTLSLGDFYARRIRRIFPALIIVLLATGLAGWFLLLPTELESLRRHIGASAIFANNILLWSEAGYFDGPSELKPLLHLWSLGVEEQFYVIWPLLIWTWWRRHVRWTVAIAAIGLASFAVNVMVVNEGAAQAAFFLPHTRLWQLATGALLAAMAREKMTPAGALSRWLYRSPGPDTEARCNGLLSMTGLTLIALSCIALSRGVTDPDWWSHGGQAYVSRVVYWISKALWLDGRAEAYPGWSALAPTIGAALVIAAGPRAAWNRAWLSTRPMVAIGLISYPLYLWHWPILSFLEISELGHVSRLMKVTAIAVSIVLAAVTYLVIERPIRRVFTPATLRRVLPIAAPLAAIGIVVVITMTTGWLTPAPATALTIDARVPMNLNEPICRARFPGLGEYCQQADPVLPVTTALLGDSHAAHFMPGLGAALTAKGVNVVHLGHTGCPPLLDVTRLNTSAENSCSRVNRAMLDAVAADTAITDVWLSFRGVLAVTGLDIGDRVPTELFRSASGATNGLAIREGLTATIQFLRAHGKHVGIFLQVPELDFRVDECTGRPVSFGHRPARTRCAMSRAAVMERQAPYRALVLDIQRTQPLTVFDPLDTLCDDSSCYAMAEGHVLYFDDNHLGQFGSSWVLRNFR